MKRYFIAFMLILGIIIPSIADDPDGSSSSDPIELTTSKNDKPSGIHRAPMHISLKAYYYAETNTIVISYDGEAMGEVTVCRNGDVVASDSEINTVLTIDGTPGLYTIEIVIESWTATGSLEL